MQEGFIDHLLPVRLSWCQGGISVQVGDGGCDVEVVYLYLDDSNVEKKGTVEFSGVHSYYWVSDHNCDGNDIGPYNAIREYSTVEGVAGHGGKRHYLMYFDHVGAFHVFASSFRSS